MKAATKDIGLAAAKGAASEAGKQALDAAVVQPLKLVGAVAEVGCQLTPLGLFNMGLGIANLAIGATSLGVGIFNAYQVLKVKNDLGALQLQTTSIGVKTQEGLEKTQEGLENVAAEVRSVGVGLSADISRLSSQLGGLVIAEGEQTRVALREVKEQLNLRLHRVDLVLGWVGTLVTVLGEQQGALSQQLAELHEDLRRGFQGLHALHKSAEQEEFQASIALVADIYRDVLFELQSGGGSAEECQELQRASKRLAAWTSSKLGRYALGDLRRAPLMVARVYALVTEVDARILGEMLTGGSGSALEGLTAEDSPHRRLCVQKLATLAREVELEARALIATQASSAYALAVDVAPILSQYALLHRSIEAKQGAGRPVIFELQEASLAAGEPHVAVRWDDGLANMRVLCSIMASDKKYEPGGSDKMELRTVADVLWLAEVLERHPEECLLADMHSIKKRVLLDALGVPERLGDGSKLEGTELAALRALSLPHLREAVEDAVNASFGSLEMPLTLPTWSEVISYFGCDKTCFPTQDLIEMVRELVLGSKFGHLLGIGTEASYVYCTLAARYLKYGRTE